MKTHITCEPDVVKIAGSTSGSSLQCDLLGQPARLVPLHMIRDREVYTVPEDYQKEDWVALYKTALTELEKAKMTRRIHAARTALVARMEKLCTLPDLHPHERQAIEDASATLRFLEREHARLDEEAGRRAVEESLQKLRSVHQSVERLSKRAGP